LCEINGHTVFLQGVNWVPLQLDYPATTDAEYRRVIGLYRKMGCNMLRVWGGAYLEKEIFYRECDEQGLLVWQEFPLSSSGVDNDAPREPAAIADLEKIATDYIRRRSHHASLFLWCGGNELQDAPNTKGGPTRPQDESHPAFAALKRVVEREQPDIRLLPTSPSGPIFYAEREMMGHGLHHHVHGPWDIRTPEATWVDYWSHDDSLFRSETGVAGAAAVSTLKNHVGDEKIWPPTFENPWWRHGSAWFVQGDLFKREISKASPSRRLALYVKLSQERQARFLALAARSCKQRFPRCAGFLVWVGHDAFPTPSNLSIIDYDRQPKAAYYALREIFLSK
jgi:beta-mannosidase